MIWPSPLIDGILLNRYKRFLADVELVESIGPYSQGQIVTAHCPNTGSMKTCWEPNCPVKLSFHDDPKRKLKFTLEATKMPNSWVIVNTNLPNKIGLEAIRNGVISELSEYDQIFTEQKIGKSRIDILLEKGSSATNREKCFVEIKNVTLRSEMGEAIFPDAISTRGQKHLLELAEIKKNGDRAVMLYIVQRNDVFGFRVADEIDPIYSDLFNQAKESGVEILVYQSSFDGRKLEITGPLSLI